MKTKSLLLAATTMALAGCAMMGGMKAGTPAPNIHCTSAGAACTVTVTVTTCPGTITVDYPVVGLVRGNGNVPIFWQLSGNSASGATFGQTAIAFKPPSSQFTNCAPMAGGTKYRCTGVNSVQGEYQYGITVMQGSTQCAYLDPTVVNE